MRALVCVCVCVRTSVERGKALVSLTFGTLWPDPSSTMLIPGPYCSLSKSPACSGSGCGLGRDGGGGGDGNGVVVVVVVVPSAVAALVDGLRQQ